MEQFSERHLISFCSRKSYSTGTYCYQQLFLTVNSPLSICRTSLCFTGSCYFIATSCSEVRLSCHIAPTRQCDVRSPYCGLHILMWWWNAIMSQCNHVETQHCHHVTQYNNAINISMKLHTFALSDHVPVQHYIMVSLCKVVMSHYNTILEHLDAIMSENIIMTSQHSLITW